MLRNEETAARAAELAYALAHPVRLQILAALAEGDSYVMDLTLALGRRQANVSQHLAVLRQVGLVAAEREGMTVRYHLCREEVPALLNLLEQLSADVPPAAVGYRRRHRRGRGRGWRG